MADDEEPKTLAGVAGAILPKVYDDLAHPTFKGFGELLGRLFLAGTGPFRAVLWSSERAEEWLVNAVGKRLRKVPAERLIAPNRVTVAQAITGVGQVGGDPVLADMFADLVASTMDSHKAPYAHPSFAEKIKQMSPDEARILKYMAKHPQVPVVTRQLERGSVQWSVRFTSLDRDASCENGNPISMTLAIDNLEHLDLLERPHWTEFIHGANYDELVARSGTYQVEGAELNGMPQCGSIRLSAIGSAFVDVCLSEEEVEIG